VREGLIKRWFRSANAGLVAQLAKDRERAEKLKEKNKRAQRKFRQRQKVSPTLTMLGPRRPNPRSHFPPPPYYRIFPSTATTPAGNRASCRRPKHSLISPHKAVLNSMTDLARMTERSGKRRSRCPSSRPLGLRSVRKFSEPPVKAVLKPENRASLP
jgi:hypothetical protein